MRFFKGLEVFPQSKPVKLGSMEPFLVVPCFLLFSKENKKQEKTKRRKTQRRRPCCFWFSLLFDVFSRNFQFMARNLKI